MTPTTDEQLLAALARLFTAGYTRGHHDTVEGGYSDVTYSDSTTYHRDAVAELIEDSDYQALTALAADRDEYRTAAHMLAVDRAEFRIRAEKAEAERDALRADAERYRWLRDESVPPHNFYVSVPVEFHDERYTKADVDAYIDAAMKGQQS